MFEKVTLTKAALITLLFALVFLSGCAAYDSYNRDDISEECTTWLYNKEQIEEHALMRLRIRFFTIFTTEEIFPHYETGGFEIIAGSLNRDLFKRIIVSMEDGAGVVHYIEDVTYMFSYELDE